MKFIIHPRVRTAAAMVIIGTTTYLIGRWQGIQSVAVKRPIRKFP